MPDKNGVIEIKDFGFTPEPKRFKLYTADPFIFEGSPVLPMGALESAAKLRRFNMDEGGGVERIIEFFDQILLPASAAELRRRVKEPSEFPFGVDMLQPVLEWMLESYGLRPTQPSSPSSSGSAADDITSSTAGAEAEASTQQLSLPIDS